MNTRGLLIVFSAPSGTGKGTVIQEILYHRPQLQLSISATTRAPRSSEREGASYFFKSQAEFERMIAAGELLEHAEVYGRYYGTPRNYVESMLDRGDDVLLEIETVGAQKVMQNMPEAISIFLLPPSMMELRRRIVGRGTETPEKIRERFEYSYIELESAYRYHYIVVNDTVQEAAQQVSAIIDAEHHKAERAFDFIRHLQEEKV